MRACSVALVAGIAFAHSLSATIGASGGARAAGPGAASAGEIDFARDIQPIFRDHCYECHGSEKRKGGLRLT
ncbi:MAG: hypothetical protein FJ144_27300, partial [Deltaproteobacteria bacterium]|nr:hypothetical protein [Deltaproteobacteria bacterium]